MSTLENQFIHYAECAQCLHFAWAILTEHRKVETPKTLEAAAYRLAIIEYAKPFMDSKVVDGSKGRLSEKKFVPRKFRPLHTRLKDLRNEALAHLDLSKSEAELFVHDCLQERSYFTMNNRWIDLPTHAEILELIEAVIDNLNLDLAERLKGLPLSS